MRTDSQGQNWNVRVKHATRVINQEQTRKWALASGVAKAHTKASHRRRNLAHETQTDYIRSGLGKIRKRRGCNNIRGAVFCHKAQW